MTPTNKQPGQRTAQVARWLTGYGISGLSVEPVAKASRILGLSGFQIFVTLGRNRNGFVTTQLHEMHSTSSTAVHVVPAVGRDVQDSIVMMRLDQFAPLLEAYIQANKERIYGGDR